MYLHVGEDILVKTKEIVAIIDKDSMKSSTDMEEFVGHQKEQVLNLSKGPYKSVVITFNKIYYSPFSSGTLKKRSQELTIKEF
jgi:extracellular matrix regulatory protein B